MGAAARSLDGFRALCTDLNRQAKTDQPSSSRPCVSLAPIRLAPIRLAPSVAEVAQVLDVVAFLDGVSLVAPPGMQPAERPRLRMPMVRAPNFPGLPDLPSKIPPGGSRR
jgi:hypothetical protein